MVARRRWGTAVGVALALMGAGGAAYVFLLAPRDTGEAQEEFQLVTDGAADAKAGRKAKAGKKGARKNKPRASATPGGPRGGSGGSGGSGGNGNAGGVDDDDDDPSPPTARPFTGRGPAGPTYEAALASNKREITIGAQSGPDLTDSQIAGPMRSGGFVGECGAPDSMKVTVKVAIKMGRAVGVSVSTSPPDPDVAGCIDRYVRTFSWPSNAKMDSFTTTY